MRALVWHGPQEMSVDDVPDLAPAAGEVLLAPEAVGICGSELEGYLGHQANRTPPLVMGHEFAGRVVELGDGVEERWRGRRVAVNPLIAGGTVLDGIEQLSDRRQLIGVHRPGGFAAAVPVPVHRLRELPDDTDPRLGALAEPLANGVHAARIGRAGVEAGPIDRVVVLGAGTIGLMTLQAALIGGASWAGVLDIHPARRAAAEALGAHATFGAPETVPGGADLVFDAVGKEGTRRLAIDLLRPGGCAVMIGLATQSTPIRFDEVIRGGLTVRGAYAYSDADYDEALAWLLDGRAGLGELEPVQPLDAGPDAFAELAAGPSERLKVFLA
jgi:(R,R)-butanediol dehydrogenase / meso-butanediol dehydrogenase / diacetyl reductase